MKKLSVFFERSTGMFFIIFLLLANMAFASDPNAILNKWNAIIVNNITSVSEIEGRTFVGGNYSISNSHQFGFKLNGNSSSDVVFAVAGNVTTNGNANIKVFYGSAAVTTSVSNTAWFSFQNGGSLAAPSSWPAANSPIADITAASVYWQTLTANSTITYPTNQDGPVKFNCATGAATAIFHVTDDQVFNNSYVQQIELNVDETATQTIIINVESTTGNINWNKGNMVGLFNNDKWRSKVIWNIYTKANNGKMGTINFNSGFGGALISPSATVTTNSNIDGSVVVANININSEIHNPNGGWSGNLPTPPSDCKDAIGGYVWNDKNLNSTIESGEQSFQSVAVELLQNSSVIASTVTDNAGKYTFSNLANGTYDVRLAASNFLSGGVFYNTDALKWFAVNNTQTISTTLNCADNLAVNFGYYKTGINFTKTVSAATAKPGNAVTYAFKVENTGDIKIAAGIDISDKLFNAVSPYNIYHIATIDAGQSVTYTKDYTVLNADCGSLVNTASVKAYPVDNSYYLTASSSATVAVDCSVPGVTGWTGKIGADSAICEQDSKWIPVNASVSITPNPSIAYLQTAWRIVKPDDGSVDNSTHYTTVSITKDTAFSISAFWPGIRPTDTLVEIHYGVNVLDKNGNVISNGIGRDLYWYTWVCPAPTVKKTDVKLEKTVSNAAPKYGDNVIYTIKATNTGSEEAKGIQVTDILPAALKYVSNSASQGQYNVTSGLWTVGNIAAGASATLTITVQVNSDSVSNSVYDLGAAKGYNLFVIQDLIQPSSDTEGKVAVGRDASLGGYSVGDKLPANSGDVLVVGRNLTYTTGRVYNGNVVYGNSTNLPLYAVSIDGTLRKDSPINFSSAKTYLENLSSTLSSYTANSSYTFQWGGLTLTGTDPYLNVFKVNASDFSSANNLEIDAPNGSVVLVNVGGKSVSWTGGLTVNGTASTNVLYNFYEAASLNIQGIDVRGSVLAPLAAVNFPSGVQNGQMICQSLKGSGQFNNSTFLGNVPYETKITNTASITASLTTDTDSTNNKSSVVIVASNGSGSGSGNSGGSGSGSTVWQQVSSFNSGEIVLAMAYKGSNMYTGTLGGKIYKSTDNGANWTVINSNMHVGWIWSLCFSNDVLFASTEQGVYKYTGSDWTLTKLSGMDVRAITTADGALYAGTWGYGIYKSTDNGASWNSFNDGVGDYKVIQSLCVDSSGNLFAGSFYGGILKKRAGETKWYKHDVGNNFIWSLASTSNAIYAGLYGGGLYKSTDDGENWSPITSLNVPFIYSIITDKSNNVYVSSWSSGVFASKDGSSWKSLGMGDAGVSSIILSANSTQVFAGTKSGKLYALDNTLNVTGVKQNSVVPASFSLSQNYPNPFNPSTIIGFTVPTAGNYSLKVYNMLGQEVASLVNGQLSAGAYKINFNASNLASGVYIYRLSGNKVNISNKMMLMK